MAEPYNPYAGQTLSPYEPTWRDRLASMMLGEQPSFDKRRSIEGLLGSSGLGDTGMSLVDFTGLGGLLDAQTQAAAGDYRSAAMAMMPGMKQAKAVGKVVEEAINPANTVRAYKLFRTNQNQPGQLFPLFVNSDKSVPVGEWVPADHPFSFKGPNGLDYIPATTGGSIPLNHLPIETRQEMVDRGLIKSVNTKNRKAVAARPGWHGGDLPVATHIGEGGSPPTYRPDNQIWAEIEMPADVDWQSKANSRALKTKKGTIDASTAHITDQVPVGGYYRYKTNPNMTGNWMIGGGMKVNRVLTDEEVKAINDANNVSDLPRRYGLLDK